MRNKGVNILVVFYFIFFLSGCKKDDENTPLTLNKMFIGTTEVDLAGTDTGLPIDRSIVLVFSTPVNENTIEQSIQLSSDKGLKGVNISLDDGKNLALSPIGALENSTIYVLTINDQLRGKEGQPFEPVEIIFKTIAGDLEVESVKVLNQDVESELIKNVPLNLSLSVHFTVPIQHFSFEEAVGLTGPLTSDLEFTYSEDDRTATVLSSQPLKELSEYEFQITDALQGQDGESFTSFSLSLQTTFDPTFDFPEVSDAELLTKIQQQTFKYFWDFGHPASGLSRERNTSGDLVTSGGSGFGVMAILVGIERGFITRQEGVDRLETIISFLLNDADRFHGAFSHWLNGNTGDVIPFSSNDDGGDLVETAFMIQGLLTVRQYLDPVDPQEESMIADINTLWEAVEWDWYTQEGQNVLYWHWSPNFGWEKNHKIQGWNEALIVYVLAASSPSHSIEKAVYEEGWTRNGAMVNSGNTYYGYQLPLRSDRGGPLFFSHYSFLGLDPRNLSDQYANYWEQNVTHSNINHAYCEANPKQFIGYADYCWGLTASDNHKGYSAHSPDNDLGVITPTAALSSMPYTPEKSMKALNHFYYILGDRLWGDYGFYDAFNLTENWTAGSYLAIDQGPIIVMIENHRSGLLWDLFMSAPEIQNGLDKLGFNYE